MPEALVEVPTKSKVLKTANNESKAPLEEPIVSKALVEVPTESKILNTAELEVVCGWSIMALPQLTRSPSSPPAGAESPKPAGEYSPEEPNCSSSSLLPAPLRARRRRGG